VGHEGEARRTYRKNVAPNRMLSIPSHCSLSPASRLCPFAEVGPPEHDNRFRRTNGTVFRFLIRGLEFREGWGISEEAVTLDAIQQPL